jgi:hypothetical protein
MAAQIKKEAICSFETFGSLQTTRRHNPGDRTAPLINRTIPKIDSYFLENMSHFHYKVQSVNYREVFSVVRTIRKNAIPITGREGPLGCEMSRLPHFLDNRLTDDGEVVSLMRRPPFTLQEES